MSPSIPETPEDRMIPVNYLSEHKQVVLGADGPCWRACIDAVFSRLRPDVPGWLPDWANGKLVVINLESGRE